MKSNIFCLKRLYFLMRRQGLNNIQKYFVGISSMVGALFLVTLLSGIGNPFFHISSLFPLYIVAFLVGGYVFTSSVFSELNSPHRSVAALTLPVSKLERLVNGWLLSAVAYPLLALLGMILIAGGTSIVHGENATSNIVSVMFSKSTFNLMLVYVITQSVFLFGAVFFRKHNFFKTLGSLFLISFIFQIVFVLGMYLMFGSTSGGFVQYEVDLTFSPDFEKFVTTTLVVIIKFVFYYVFAPFFWLLTWFGIKEREV